MSALVDAVKLLLDQQVRHGDGVYSVKAKAALFEIDKEYSELTGLTKSANLSSSAPGPRPHTISSLDEIIHRDDKDQGGADPVEKIIGLDESVG